MSKRSGYHALALFVVAVWGLTFISTKVLIADGLHPALIFAIRFLMAYIGIWIVCVIRKNGTRIRSLSLRDEVMARLGNITSTNYVYLNPIFTLIGASAILGERMTLMSAFGSVAILAGVIVARSRGKSV